MKYAVKQPTNLRDAITELGPYIRDDELGYRFECYDGLLLREALGNWLLCAVLNDRNPDPDRYTFTTEPRDGPGADGAILDRTAALAMAAEHVMVAKRPDGQRPEESAEQLVLAAIEKKVAKGGSAYASGKVLVVYLDADVAGYSPRELRALLPVDFPFEGVWLVVPQAGRWDYDVVYLSSATLDPPTYHVSITETFDDWSVKHSVWLGGTASG
jgi:hypothetical protein